MIELVLGRRGGKPIARRAVPASFTAAKQKLFLDALAVTCNVLVAAEAAGVNSATLYNRRRSDPAFAAQWREAIEIGYDRLEALALEHAGAGQAMPAPDPESALEALPDLPPFDFDKAMEILRRYQHKRDGTGRPVPGRPATAATRAETNAALTKALRAAERRIARQAARDAANV